MLDKARQRAREVGQQGALFPWRTINGEEASAYYAAGTAQYHINADIAYAIRKYVEVTGDVDFLHRYGAEILVETARLWADLGFFNPTPRGRRSASPVSPGPTSTHGVVDNNYLHQPDGAGESALCRGNRGGDAGRITHGSRAALVRRYRPRGARARRAGRAPPRPMYLPYDEALGIHPQDDSFLDKQVWDFAGTPPENYPLLLHYHPLGHLSPSGDQAGGHAARHVSARATTSPAEQKKRNFDYYDPLTTRDSSLSVCIQSIVAAEVGYAQKALDYFNFAVAMDLSDVGGNVTARRPHRLDRRQLARPRLRVRRAPRRRGSDQLQPEPAGGMERASFQLQVRGSLLRVVTRRDETSYRLLNGPSLTFHHQTGRHANRKIELTPENPEIIVVRARDGAASIDTPEEAAE